MASSSSQSSSMDYQDLPEDLQSDLRHVVVGPRDTSEAFSWQQAVELRERGELEPWLRGVVAYLRQSNRPGGRFRL